MKTIENDRLLRVLNGQSVDRPPVWLMRQAGRILPEYRALRKRVKGFTDLVRQPDLAAEATLQPVEALGIDAAIIFSDILVIPEAMGLPYRLVEQVGPVFDQVIQEPTDIDRLDDGATVLDRIQYVFDAIDLAVKRIDGRIPLIGFTGAPWTLLCYMIEGRGSKTFSRAKAFVYRYPAETERLLAKVTEVIIRYVEQQVRAGADAIQLFDSWAGILTPEHYQRLSLSYIRQICEALPDTPTIVFAKGAWFALDSMRSLPCEAIGIDWNTSPAVARSVFGNKRPLQGNLDPCQLYAQPSEIQRSVRRMLEAFGHAHIANLGHGVYPDTPLDNVRCFVESVQSYRY